MSRHPQYEERFEAACRNLADLLRRKRGAYGGTIAATGMILRAVFPDGIRPEQYDDLGLIVRIADKLRRIASSGRAADGENPYQDIAGYGICGVVDLAAPEEGPEEPPEPAF